jgi:hypothetical protein
MGEETKRYVEYVKSTGKILSVLNATATRALLYASETVGILEVPSFFYCDHSAFLVREGKIVRAFSEEERSPHEDIDVGKLVGIREMRRLALGLLEASLFEDEKRILELKEQAAPLKSLYLYVTKERG